MSETIRDRLLRVQERIATAALRATRDPSTVTLVAVSKTMPVEVIRQALDAGVGILGENRVQEAKEKIAALPGGAAWHLVGHLQTNKAKLAVQLFEVIHSVDSIKLVQALDRHGKEAGKRVRCLVEVNLEGEASKSGTSEADAREVVNAARDLAHVQVEGLMTIPPLLPNPEEVRPYFRRLRALRDTLQGGGLALPELSMGMTHDFEVAIEEGATLVRIGTAIFGARTA
jgi:pyridoxal phosphate enzyme (YggS family)